MQGTSATPVGTTSATVSSDSDAELVSPLQRLRVDPCAFGFFQAVRLLYGVHHFDARGNAAQPGPIRFTTPASLSFPASELDSLELDATGSWRMCVRFLGLTGPSGVLPRLYTEQVIALVDKRDRAMQDFLDLFNHRLLTLFWRAWAKYRPEIGREFGFRNSPLRFIHHLVGLGTPALQARLAQPADAVQQPRLPDAATAYFAGLISQRPHGAGSLSQVVGAVVDAPVAVEGCLGTWQRVPATDRTRLARSSAGLGQGCLLGERYWDRQTTLRLRVGPLDRTRFRALLPRAASGSRQSLLGDVAELVRFLTGLALDLRMTLSVCADAVPPLRLGQRDDDRPRLGWNTWLCGRRDPLPANDCVFHFSAMGAQSWR